MLLMNVNDNRGPIQFGILFKRYVNDDWEDEDITEMNHHMVLKIKLLVILRYVHDAAFCDDNLLKQGEFSAVFCVTNTWNYNHLI